MFAKSTAHANQEHTSRWMLYRRPAPVLARRIRHHL